MSARAGGVAKIAIVIPDTGRLISLARTGRLDLIDRFRNQDLIFDAVRIKQMDGPRDDPNERALMDLIDQSGNRMRVMETSWGELLKENLDLPCRWRRVPGEVPQPKELPHSFHADQERPCRDLRDTRSEIQFPDLAVLEQQEPVVRGAQGIHIAMCWKIARWTFFRHT